jgi:hypothetical protein
MCEKHALLPGKLEKSGRSIKTNKLLPTLNPFVQLPLVRIPQVAHIKKARATPIAVRDFDRPADDLCTKKPVNDAGF